MRHGVLVPNIGPYADPNVTVELAHAAESAGWEAVLLWDHLGFMWGQPTADPWTVLAAVGASTSKVVLGTAVTPVGRRRPHVLAHQLATLDKLTGGGRVVFGAGLGGVPREFGAFGEDEDAKVRAEQLDEGLGVMRRLLSGEEVAHHGSHYTVEDVTMQPAPATPIPFWIGGSSAPARRRAARWEGWVPETADQKTMVVSPEQLAEQVAETLERRDAEMPFDVAVYGYSNAGDTSVTDAYEAAGATWWLEYVHDRRGTVEEMRQRIEAGPERR
jgi:alkanesulfonate monooxygenase SsuD/methylene tetrahydromethanopterin reductase-like flavin-dependent oxidoreductase (luciferase family)